ncbi:MAG: molybdenum cofactor biosynthesis protein MoaE [Gemmatimonadota bacterium]
MAGYLTDQPLDADRLIAEVSSNGCGGTSLFLGTVRNSPEDGDIEGIEYSAYSEMAEAEFDRIIAEARGRWPMARVALRHRLGYIPAGEASIAIAASSPHRVEAFDACRYVIEETKKRVPIWKKERFAAGTTRWVEPMHV